MKLLGAATAAFQTQPSSGRMRPVLEPGTVLKDTYAVRRLIGRGGMGEVYEVGHVRLSGRYAVKLAGSGCRGWAWLRVELPRAVAASA